RAARTVCCTSPRRTASSATALTSAEHNPEDAVRRGDVQQTVRAALKVLPDEQRRAVVLAAVYGRTALEISESEGIPLGTAKTRIRTALIRLRAAVEQAEHVEHAERAEGVSDE